MFGYKVLSELDKAFSGNFDLEAVPFHPRYGAMLEGTTGSPG